MEFQVAKSFGEQKIDNGGENEDSKLEEESRPWAGKAGKVVVIAQTFSKITPCCHIMSAMEEQQVPGMLVERANEKMARYDEFTTFVIRISAAPFFQSFYHLFLFSETINFMVILKVNLKLKTYDNLIFSVTYNTTIFVGLQCLHDKNFLVYESKSNLEMHSAFLRRSQVLNKNWKEADWSEVIFWGKLHF